MRVIFLTLFLCNIQAIQTVQAASDIRLRNSGGKCLAVKGKSLVKEGKSVHIWNCNRSNSQSWRFDGKQRLVNAAGKCLSSQGSGNAGERVVINSCNDSSQQRWVLDSRDRLINQRHDKCLEVPDGDLRKKGGKTQLWHCNNSINQRWFKDFIIGDNNLKHYSSPNT